MLSIDRKYYNALNIEGFSMMMKSPSYCYKFYWLEALVKLISEDADDVTLGDVIDEMIFNAWYSVREFHIHLTGSVMGEYRDGLELAVNRLAELCDLPAAASRVEVKNAIREHESEMKAVKKQLTNMVPTRALSGFFEFHDEIGMEKVDFDNRRGKRLNAYIREFNARMPLPYVFDDGSGLEQRMIVDPEWAQMIRDNTVEILGWVQHEKAKWLQSNNPEVPGIVYKLALNEEKTRKLERVHKLWDGVRKFEPVRDVYTGELLDGKYDVDHFIPWSFVMNDELWNLTPMDSSLNSSKSNKLPRWEPFFERFAENQFMMYELVQSKEGIHKLYIDCMKDNLHSIWAGQELYVPGNSREMFFGVLEKNMRPVYDSAKRQGYEVWRA